MPQIALHNTPISINHTDRLQREKLIEIQGHDIQGLSILCILLVVQLF